MAHGTMEEKIYKRQVVAEHNAFIWFLFLNGSLTK